MPTNEMAAGALDTHPTALRTVNKDFSLGAGSDPRKWRTVLRRAA